MLAILGIVLVVVSTILIYKTARQNGHNALLWTLLSIFAGIVLELVIPTGGATILAGIWFATGKSLPAIQKDLSGPALALNIVCLVLNFVAAFLIMKKVSPLAEENPFVPPPPPSDFDIDN